MNNYLENWRQFWGELGANQRVSIAVSAIAVIGAMVGLFMWAQRPDMKLLYGSVNAKDASSIIQHLESQGIPYEMRAGGSAIFVPSDKVYQARMDVVSQGIVQGDAVGFEIFDRSSFGISDFVQRTNFTRAVQGELSRTIQQLNGVRSARVMVVVPDNRLLLVNSSLEPTASVFIDVGGIGIGPDAVRSIQALVANAVEGLSTGNVAVVDNRGTVLSKDEDEDSLMGASNGVVEFRQNLENYFSGKVESMLERVVGIGNAVVRVSADIEARQISRLEEDFNEDGTVLRRSTSREETSTTVEGARASGGDQEDIGTSGSDSSSIAEESRDRDQSFEIDRIVTNTVEGPGTVRRLTASVFIAAQVDAPAEEGAESVIQNRTPEELDRLRQMVANALGISTDDPTTGAVAIEEVVFNMSTSPELEEASSSPFDPATLLKFGEEIFGGLIALVIFLVFLNMLKKANQQAPNLLDQMTQARRGARPNGMDGPPAEMVTPELLNDLIKQKPENAASTLRNWLSGPAQE